MRIRQVHAALEAFVEEAAARLHADAAGGEEVPFEVVESGDGRGQWRPGPALYCYRTRADRFIAQRAGILARLPTHLPALHGLVALGRLDGYLEARGERVPRDPRERADAALLALLARVFEEATEFVVDPRRLAAALDELDRTTVSVSADTEVLVPLHGIDLASEDVALAGDLALVRLDALGEDAPPQGDGPAASVFAALRWEPAAGDPDPAAHARVRVRRLVVALRLFDGAGVTAGPVAHQRTGEGPWAPFLLGPAGPPEGHCHIEIEHEDELRAFCSLVARRTPRRGELAWALRRFELACERPQPAEALTDVLLALRALLEPEGPGSHRLASRVAALCALPEDREHLAARVARAAAQERAVVTGLAVDPDLDELVAELRDHLRALLRDVLCGHLDADLRGTADRLLSADQPTAA